MRRVVTALGAGLAFSIVSAGFASHAEVRPGETLGLGLMGAEVPDLLKTVAADPYRAPAEPACETIPAELRALDDILGPEAGQPRKQRSQVAKWAMGSVRGMVPYRGVVRFLTRADKRDRALMEATMAGFARRGFLRGVEAHLHCAAPPTQIAGPDLDAPAPVVASAAAPAVAVVTIETSYTPAEPGGPPTVSRDLANLTLTGAAAATASDDGPPDPGR